MTIDTKPQAPALDDVKTLKEAGDEPADSPKRQGDKLGIGAAEQATASELGRTGDSPKRHGDDLAHAVEEAAKR